jgi:hypothetical protein
VVTNSKVVARLKNMATCKTRGCKDACYGEAARVMAVWAFPAKNLPADFSHINVICVESFSKDAVIHIAVGVYKEEDVLSSCLPLLYLQG